MEQAPGYASLQQLNKGVQQTGPHDYLQPQGSVTSHSVQG